MDNIQISPNSYIQAQEEKISELLRELLFSNARVKDLTEENNKLREQLGAENNAGTNESNG